jgi:hypothetical protein
MPVSIASSTSMRYRAGIPLRIVANCATVMIRFGFLTTWGSAVWVRGLVAVTRSMTARAMTARAEILCTSAWYFSADDG